MASWANENDGKISFSLPDLSDVTAEKTELERVSESDQNNVPPVKTKSSYGN